MIDISMLSNQYRVRRLWESGRGYSGIDSLKEISRYFSVTIDDLICSDEMITVAENDKKEFVSKYVSLICNALDILLAILLFIPAFGNGIVCSIGVAIADNFFPEIEKLSYDGYASSD